MDNATSNMAYWVLGVIIVLAVLFAAWWWATGSNVGIPNTGTPTQQQVQTGTGM